jgi:L-threonylcarbamoyladenylate synthase
MRAVIDTCGFPLAAPSANRSNELSPTNAEHVQAQLGDNIPLIVDGGQCQVGIESTVVDATIEPPRILRPGMIHAEAVLAATGSVRQGETEERTLRSPGLLLKHYAPKARLLRLVWGDENDLQRQLNTLSVPAEGLHVVAHTHIPTGEIRASVSVIPHDPEAYARALYAALHRCDAAGAKTIVVEAVPQTPEWEGIADRLNRAGSGNP